MKNLQDKRKNAKTKKEHSYLNWMEEEVLEQLEEAHWKKQMKTWGKENDNSVRKKQRIIWWYLVVAILVLCPTLIFLSQTANHEGEDPGIQLNSFPVEPAALPADPDSLVKPSQANNEIDQIEQPSIQMDYATLASRYLEDHYNPELMTSDSSKLTDYELLEDMYRKSSYKQLLDKTTNDSLLSQKIKYYESLEIQALAYFKLGQYNEAISKFSVIIDKNSPYNPFIQKVAFNRALCLLALGKIQETKMELEAMTKDRDNNYQNQASTVLKAIQ